MSSKRILVGNQAVAIWQAYSRRYRRARPRRQAATVSSRQGNRSIHRQPRRRVTQAGAGARTQNQQAGVVSAGRGRCRQAGAKGGEQAESAGAGGRQAVVAETVTGKRQQVVEGRQAERQKPGI